MKSGCGVEGVLRQSDVGVGRGVVVKWAGGGVVEGVRVGCVEFWRGVQVLGGYLNEYRIFSGAG